MEQVCIIIAKKVYGRTFSYKGSRFKNKNLLYKLVYYLFIFQVIYLFLFY